MCFWNYLLRFFFSTALAASFSAAYTFEDCENHNFPPSVPRHGDSHTEGDSCYMVLDFTNRDQPTAEGHCHDLGAQLAVLESSPAILFQPKMVWVAVYQEQGASAPDENWVWRNWDGTTIPVAAGWWRSGEPNDASSVEDGTEDSGLLLGNLGKIDDRHPSFNGPTHGPRPLCQFKKPTQCVQYSHYPGQKIKQNVLPLSTAGRGDPIKCGQECSRTTVCRSYSVAKNGTLCLMGKYTPVSSLGVFEADSEFDTYFLQ